MEIIYHYIWHNMILGRRIATRDGRIIEILFPGRHNDNAGPDFLDVRLSIDGQQWIGNVEIHVKASDWFRHGHDKDPAYGNVILHVVAIDDTTVKMPDGRILPQISATLPERFFTTYAALAEKIKAVRCASGLGEIPNLIVEDWLSALAAERLQAKASRLLEYNSQLGGDWEQAVFTLLARGLGFGLNGLPFEILAKNLPLRILYHHSDNLMQIEALLFGQAGMLDATNNIFDEYYQQLCAEYAFLARKYSLRPISLSLWKYARTRPQNFPHRRLALLAQAIHCGTRFSSELLEAKGDYDRLYNLFSWQLSGYWHEHAGFGSDARDSSSLPALSKGSRNLLMINVAAPFYMAYSRISGDFDAGELAFDLLASLPGEKNTKIRMWQSLGLHANDALHSQALLHLHDEYCDKGRCLECRLGHHLLRREAHPHINSRLRADINTFRYTRLPQVNA